jgi:hypothetical protein
MKKLRLLLALICFSLPAMAQDQYVGLSKDSILTIVTESVANSPLIYRSSYDVKTGIDGEIAVIQWRTQVKIMGSVRPLTRTFLFPQDSTNVEIVVDKYIGVNRKTIDRFYEGYLVEIDSFLFTTNGGYEYFIDSLPQGALVMCAPSYSENYPLAVSSELARMQVAEIFEPQPEPEPIEPEIIDTLIAEEVVGPIENLEVPPIKRWIIEDREGMIAVPLPEQPSNRVGILNDRTPNLFNANMIEQIYAIDSLGRGSKKFQIYIANDQADTTFFHFNRDGDDLDSLAESALREIYLHNRQGRPVESIFSSLITYRRGRTEVSLLKSGEVEYLVSHPRDEEKRAVIADAVRAHFPEKGRYIIDYWVGKAGGKWFCRVREYVP